MNFKRISTYKIFNGKKLGDKVAIIIIGYVTNTFYSKAFQQIKKSNESTFSVCQPEYIPWHHSCLLPISLQTSHRVQKLTFKAVTKQIKGKYIMFENNKDGKKLSSTFKKRKYIT